MVARTRGKRSLAGLAVSGWLLACSASPVMPPPSEVHSVESPYVIGAADQLQIRVWKNPELSVEVPVRPDGMISVPLLDDVQAAGLTTEELKKLITRELSEFVANPDVTVIVSSTGSKRAFLIGGVARQGSVPLATDMRVTDAISAAGGFSPFADKKRVKIIRRAGEEDVEYLFNYEAYIDGDAPGTNLILRPGDTVVVPD